MKQLIYPAMILAAATTARAGAQEVRTCAFEAKARCASGDASVTLKGGVVTRLEVNMFWCGENSEKPHDSAVSTAKAVEAGAPAVSESVQSALDGAFRDWISCNSQLIDYGLPGDLYDLRLRLNAAFTKALISTCDTSSASKNSFAASVIFLTCSLNSSPEKVCNFAEKGPDMFLSIKVTLKASEAT